MKVVGKGGFGKVNAVTRRNGTEELMALKRMQKSLLIGKKIYVETVWSERNVMAKFTSHFLVGAEHCFQNEEELFLVMPFCQGGDLRYYLNTQGRMDEPTMKFYAIELVLGLEELEKLNIVYRDLKPDNVLLDANGHLKISDFGLAVQLDKRNNYACHGSAGTPGYLAPEVQSGRQYGHSADIYSLGCTLYEFLEKRRPYGSNGDQKKPVHFTAKTSEHCRDMIRRMLSYKVSDRIGCGVKGIEEVKEHPFFEGVDWEKHAKLDSKPPFMPDTERANCSANFELEDQFFGDVKAPKLTPEQQKLFEGFEYNVAVDKVGGEEAEAGKTSTPTGGAATSGGEEKQSAEDETKKVHVKGKEEAGEESASAAS